jgi:hypothetical protein
MMTKTEVDHYSMNYNPNGVFMTCALESRVFTRELTYLCAFR